MIAGPALHAHQRGDTIVLAARMPVGSYGASCELPGFNVGTSLQSSDPVTGRIRIRVPLFGHRGAFTCWLRLGPLFTDPAAPLPDGQPATVQGQAR